MSETSAAPGPQMPAGPVGATWKSAERQCTSPFIRVDLRLVTNYAERIGADALALYVVLRRFADNITGQCFPSLSTLCRLLRRSRPTVLKAIRTLEEHGLIKVERRRTKRGNRLVNVYTLLPLTDGEAALPPLVNDVDHPGKGDLPELDLINKTQENKSAGASPASAGTASVSLPPPPHPVPAYRSDEGPRDPNLDHPATMAYLEQFGLTPTKVQAAAIAAEISDIETWRVILQEWQLANWNKQNVAGMLDRYKKRLVERSGRNEWHAGNRRGGSQGFRSGGQRAYRPETPDEAAANDAEWDNLPIGLGNDEARDDECAI